MPKQIRFNGQIHSFPDDFSDDQISMALQSLGGETKTPSTPAAATPPTRTWTDTAVDALPMIGGAVGGILGGIGGAVGGVGFGGIPGAAAGATLGGGAGEAWRQNINRWRGKDAPESPMDAAKSIVTAGAKEGATDLIGGAVGKHIIAPVATPVFRGVASGITKFAYRPSKEALKVNPNVVGDILDQGIKLSERGLVKAESLTQQAKRIADEMVENLETAPRKFLSTPKGLVATNAAHTGAELIDPVFASQQAIKANATGKNTLGQIMAGADTMPGVKMAENVRESVQASLPEWLSPKRLQEIKRAEGSKAAAVFGDTPDVATRKSFNADLHNAADAALERRLGPAWTAANKETQRRLITQNTVKDALGTAGAETHMPTPYDQYLMFRGLSTGDPLQVAIALAREAGRVRQFTAAVGRGIDKGQNVKHLVTPAARTVRMLSNEEQKADKQRAKGAKKTQIDALYEKYKAGGQ